MTFATIVRSETAPVLKTLDEQIFYETLGRHIVQFAKLIHRCIQLTDGMSNEQLAVSYALEGNDIIQKLERMFIRGSKFNWQDIESEVIDKFHNIVRFASHMDSEVVGMYAPITDAYFDLDREKKYFFRNAKTMLDAELKKHINANLQEHYSMEVDDDFAMEDDATEEERFLRLINWKDLCSEQHGFPFVVFKVYPQHVEIAEETMMNMTTAKMDNLIAFTEDAYGSFPEVRQRLINGFLTFCNVSALWIAQNVNEDNVESWIVISEHCHEALRYPGTITAWRNRLDWQGTALNEVLTISQMNEFDEFIHLPSLFRHSTQLTLEHVEANIEGASLELMKAIFHSQPITMEIVKKVERDAIAKFGEVETSFLINELDYNPYLTPEIAYHYIDYLLTREAEELAGEYYAYISFCKADKLVGRPATTIMQFVGVLN